MLQEGVSPAEGERLVGKGWSGVRRLQAGEGGSLKLMENQTLLHCAGWKPHGQAVTCSSVYLCVKWVQELKCLGSRA